MSANVEQYRAMSNNIEQLKKDKSLKCPRFNLLKAWKKAAFATLPRAMWVVKNKFQLLFVQALWGAFPSLKKSFSNFFSTSFTACLEILIELLENIEEVMFSQWHHKGREIVKKTWEFIFSFLYCRTQSSCPKRRRGKVLQMHFCNRMFLLAVQNSMIHVCLCDSLFHSFKQNTSVLIK